MFPAEIGAHGYHEGAEAPWTCDRGFYRMWGEGLKMKQLEKASNQSRLLCLSQGKSSACSSYGTLVGFNIGFEKQELQIAIVFVF